jgi:hypothetical protein
MTELPKNWDRLSLDALSSALNDPARYATPQSTVEAILYCVRTRGIAALEEPNNKERIARCDAAAKQQIKAAIARMGEKGAIS